MSRLLVLLLLLISCQRPSEQRALRDEQIGQAEAENVRVTVTDGAAVVRSLSRSTIRLWSSAPTFQARLEATPAWSAPVELRLDNVLTDTTVSVTGTGCTPSATLTSGAGTPRQVWTLDATGCTAVDLTLSAPDVNDATTWEFLVLGDVQNAIDRVEDIYNRMNEENSARFVVFVGDQTEQGSFEQLDVFESKMATLRIPIYGTLGNHELGTDDGIPYQERFGRANSSFVFRGTRFTLLDSASATIDPLVYPALNTWLDASRNQLHVVAMHIPIVDPVGTRGGSFASTAEAQQLLAKLVSGNVAATFYGHVHSFYEYSNASIPAYISGGGGAIPEKMDGLGRHFLSVEADPVKREVKAAVVRVDRD